MLPADLVMVGQSPQLNAAAACPLGQFFRGQGAVGDHRMTVQIGVQDVSGVSHSVDFKWHGPARCGASGLLRDWKGLSWPSSLGRLDNEAHPPNPLPFVGIEPKGQLDALRQWLGAAEPDAIDILPLVLELEQQMFVADQAL